MRVPGPGDLEGEEVPTAGRPRPLDPVRARGYLLRVFGQNIFATHALPPVGDVVIGRSRQVEIHIDEAAISRRHAVLHLGASITIADLGSQNGTRVGGRTLAKGEVAPVTPGEVVDLGSVMIVIQPQRTESRPRRLWPHGYFEGRVEEECARADRTRAAFALARIHVDGPGPPEALEQLVAAQLRASDVMATYAPGEYEALLLDTTPEAARELLGDLERTLGQAGVRVHAGLALYPEHGRTPEALIAHAGGAVRGRGGQERRSPPVVVPDGAMQKLDRLVQRIAAGTITVLLLGETGVGKEVTAAAIHRASPRAGGPYVRLNCSAFSEALLESELFGHERGAFTGAVQAKPGLIETAHGGTLLLDEVGELPLGLQAKLLRVLEDRQVLRVGALKPRTIDVRFIAATNRDLQAEIERGRFRQDLYFRLNGVSLMIAPLRERRDEIEGLARAFVAEACKQQRRSRPPELAPEVLALFQQYDWPGNIRELRNWIERAVLLCTDDRITLADLPIDRATAAPPRSGAGAASALWGQVNALEREQIVQALASCNGNQTQAAKLLGISRVTLVARMEQYGLPRPRKRSP